MSIFWLSIAVITVCALAVIVIPLLRHRADKPFDKSRIEYDVVVYKDQLNEVDRDLERGLLTEDQAEAVRTEIQRKLLQAVDGGETAISGVPFSNTPRSAILTVTAIALFVSIGTVSSYGFLGSPELKNVAYADRDIEQEKVALKEWQADQEVLALLDKLALRLEKKPDDIKGWRLLGRFLIARGNYEESAKAYKRANDLRPDDPEIFVDYAEALIFENEGNVSGAVMRKLRDTLTSAPTNPKIRYYIGLYKSQNDDLAGALQDWTDLAAMSPKDAPWMPTVRQQLEDAFSKAGVDPTTVKPSPIALEIAASTDLSPVTGPTAEDIKAAKKMSPEDQDKMINNMVNRLAERLRENPDDPVGWARLGRSYQMLNRYEKSKEAYSNAYRQAPENTEIALAYGEILVIENEGYVNQTARAAFEKVLLSDSTNVKARFYFGLALAETKEETPRAIKIWEELLAELPKNAPMTASLIEQIKRAKKALGNQSS